MANKDKAKDLYKDLPEGHKIYNGIQLDENNQVVGINFRTERGGVKPSVRDYLKSKVLKKVLKGLDGAYENADVVVDKNKIIIDNLGQVNGKPNEFVFATIEIKVTDKNPYHTPKAKANTSTEEIDIEF